MTLGQPSMGDVPGLVYPRWLLQALTLPNGDSQTYAFDNASQLTGITYKQGASTLGNLSYGYDLAGEESLQGGTWARTNLPTALSSAIYDDANELTNWGGASIGHDAAGNLTSDGSDAYTWNSRGQLASISGGTSASFVYDGFNRRQNATFGSATTQFLYDGANPIQEQSASGTPTVNYLDGLGIDQTLVRSDSAGAQDFLTDPLGSTVALTSSSGAVQSSYTYDPFGAATVSGSAANTHGFTGRESDPSGLDYLRFRYYSPGLGRFMSQDPLGYPGGPSPNLYAYVGDDPVDATDPFGLNPFVKFFADVLFFALVTVVTEGLADAFIFGEVFGEEGFLVWLSDETGGMSFGRDFEAVLNSSDRTFARWLEYLESDASNAGRATRSADELGRTWEEASMRGWKIEEPGGMDWENSHEWKGGPHWDITKDGKPIHFPVIPPP